jgi:hypothetical protein
MRGGLIVSYGAAHLRHLKGHCHEKSVSDKQLGGP